MVKIRVYSSPACPYCVALKNFLKERDFDFEELDVSQDREVAEEMIKKSRQMGVPVIEIGEEIVVGFDREKISRLLNIKE